jgi:hypothetical protein
MPIRINLLSEALAEEEQRRRDPVKRAIYAGAFLVALSLVWWSSSWLGYMVESQELNRVEAQIQAHTNDYALVQSNLKKIDNIQIRMDALDHLTAARFLQGNLMHALQQTYVPNVQLTHFKLDQFYTQSPAVATKPGGPPGHPAGSTEHITFTMDARDFSPNPGDQMQHFKDALLKQAYFNELMATNGIHLSGVSPLQTPPEGKPFVTFSLECRFADKTP